MAPVILDLYIVKIVKAKYIITMSEFKNPPTVAVLHTFVRGSLIDGNRTKAAFTKFNKAVRLWYTLTQLGSEFKQEEFTSKEWRKYIDPHGPDGRDENLSSAAPPADPVAIDPDDLDDKDENLSLDSKSIATKEIREILSYQQDEWDRWKESFTEFYSDAGTNRQGKSKEELLEYLNLSEEQKPFDVTGATIFGDIKTLKEQGYLQFVGDDTGKGESKLKFKLTGKILNLETASPDRSEQIIELNLKESASLSDDFSSYIYLFSKPLGVELSKADPAIQRFYIHSDYRIADLKDLARTNLHQGILKDVWKKPIIPLIRLEYQSASKGESYKAIISPVQIYYHQRAFYLCGFGVRGSEAELSWHNYRIDRIEKIDVVDASRDDIPQDLRDLGERTRQIKLVEEIKDALEAAYGFDFYQPKQLMLLRFNRDFHDRYIKHTWRHDTFHQVDRPAIEKLIQGKDLAEQRLISKRINAHPHDAYYTMNYRVGDNGVIMRLRAWCPNVEVLSPFDLRDRMHDDLQKAWELYREANE